MNDISLDPQNMSTQVELAESSLRIAPYAGSITKVQFTTKKVMHFYQPNHFRWLTFAFCLTGI